ncbi:MAG TPA: DUF192 domain-containing protein [Acidimicrobiales bacterium]|nr:DUF192 domain-containing protein [Acidimicrobiales bacterium]
MAWLLRDGEVLAALEVVETLSARSRGLLGRDGIEGAMLIKPARSVHTLGMRFPIDVAFCNRDMTVIDVVTMGRHRIGRPRLRARSVLEAEAGAFERWGLRPGDQLELKGEP